MSTKFSSIYDAKVYVAFRVGVAPETFEEVDDLKVVGFEASLLDDPDTSEEIKKEIRDRIEAQKAFKFKTPEGIEIKIVIGPFRDGFDCCIVGDNGAAMRL